MEPEWREFLANWMTDRGVVQTAAAAELLRRLKRSETYGLAHTEWLCGASDHDVRRLLDQAKGEGV